MGFPLVSVICISYNHADFIEEAVHSVIRQSYTNNELIIIDNGSEDATRDKIEILRKKHQHVKVVYLDSNIGNCKAFNIGLGKVNGDFIIDLSADDVLMESRIEEGLKSFLNAGAEYGVNFSDAAYIDEAGRITGYHYRRDKLGNLVEEVPQGMIYKDLLAKYFICSPTMMMRRNVLDQLGGYDENLAYEDFDFWIRSGKITKYCYTDKILVKKRILKNSLSTKQYTPGSDILYSTYLICLKAEKLNETDGERQALVKRVQFEFRKALFSGNFSTAGHFSEILLRNTDPGIKKLMIRGVNYLLSIFIHKKNAGITPGPLSSS